MTAKSKMSQATFGRGVVNTNTALSDKLKKQVAGKTPWKARERQPDEALPPSINIYKLPPYVPPADTPIRPGAHDYRSVQSRGFSC